MSSHEPTSSVQYGTGLHSLLDHPLVSRDREPVACPGDRHVEEPTLVRVAALVAGGWEAVPRDEPVLYLAGPRGREPLGGHRRDEDDRPLEALGPVHGREVDGVEVEVVLTVEVLVRTLGVVDDVDREVPVVPVASILAADLLALDRGVGPGTRDARTRSRRAAA